MACNLAVLLMKCTPCTLLKYLHKGVKNIILGTIWTDCQCKIPLYLFSSYIDPRGQGHTNSDSQCLKTIL